MGEMYPLLNYLSLIKSPNSLSVSGRRFGSKPESGKKVNSPKYIFPSLLYKSTRKNLCPFDKTEAISNILSMFWGLGSVKSLGAAVPLC